MKWRGAVVADEVVYVVCVSVCVVQQLCGACAGAEYRREPDVVKGRGLARAEP